MPGGAAAPISGNVFKEGLFPRHYFVAFVLVTSLFFLWGFAYGLLDVLNSHFRSTLHITPLQSTGLQVAYFGWGYFAFSPVAGEVMRRKGYKFTILMGLFFYSLGAIFFWPCAKFSETASNKQAVFGGFVVCTGVTAMGLASLEVAANSYIAVMPPVSVSSLRLQFSQSFNGVASFAGPLIASKYFFSGKNAGSNTNVQWVYLAVAGMGALIAVCFAFVKLPEVNEADLFSDQDDATVHKPLWKEHRATTGAIAQFLYVGAQVTIGAFFLFYVEDSAGLAQARGAQLLSYALIMFTVARFISTALLSVISAPVLLCIYAVLATLCTILIATLHGNGGVAMIMLVMFFESIMYPVIFTLATQNLGFNTRRAAAMVVMGVSGGAVFPPIQGAIMDRHGVRVSFWLVVPCFVYIALWAVYIWNKDGRYFSPLQARKDGGAWDEGSVVNDDEKAQPVVVEDAGKGSGKW
ncbi:hypothetical protein VHUM_04165 [Vanrija humicola]|uniref:Major facilitator superfamily (MFS) profile domain-containing protein n=1 Tax=Vanrija humicola TaxID=5417 RepID=A0A7D8UWS7_VANHU|nr:hypothetical protein VHUM_04165 [Vanrija humicola]